MAQALHMMAEPSNTLSWSAQEERRRTLWSIYLLDKMATCGRRRPSLFLDQTCQLQLPCSENSFRTSTPEKVITLEEFKKLDDYHIIDMDSFARTIAVASTLSQVAAYAFQQNAVTGQRPPWDPTSEYVMICSHLTRFETLSTSFSRSRSASTRVSCLITTALRSLQNRSYSPTFCIIFAIAYCNILSCCGASLSHAVLECLPAFSLVLSKAAGIMHKNLIKPWQTQSKQDTKSLQPCLATVCL
jgi:hypothetical protein